MNGAGTVEMLLRELKLPSFVAHHFSACQN